MALDLNDPDLKLSDLLFAYQTWVLAVLNDEKLNQKERSSPPTRSQKTP